MDLLNAIINKIEKNLKKYDFFEYNTPLCLRTSSYLKSNKYYFDTGEPFTEKHFKKYNFWVTTDDGVLDGGYNSITEFIEKAFNDLEYLTEWLGLKEIDGQWVQIRDFYEQFKRDFTKDIEQGVKEKGYIEIQPGVFINSSENLIADQTQWPDSDLSKYTDFTKYNFWITTDSGSPPAGFDFISEAIQDMYKEAFKQKYPFLPEDFLERWAY